MAGSGKRLRHGPRTGTTLSAASVTDHGRKRTSGFSRFCSVGAAVRLLHPLILDVEDDLEDLRASAGLPLGSGVVMVLMKHAICAKASKGVRSLLCTRIVWEVLSLSDGHTTSEGNPWSCVATNGALPDDLIRLQDVG
jgi:hypothetical protein